MPPSGSKTFKVKSRKTSVELGGDGWIKALIVRVDQPDPFPLETVKLPIETV